MNRKIKVLFYTELWANAGVESVIMSLFRNMDTNCFSVDIMASQNQSDFYDAEIEKLGGRKIITLEETYDSPAKRMLANRKAFEQAIKSNKYDVVHIHMCNAAAMVYGRIAKKNGVPVVAYHSHNTNLGDKHRIIKTVIHKLCKVRYERYADLLFSCSDLASKWMFSQKAIKQGKVVLLKNAIDLERFSFNPTVREEYRKKLGVENKLVIGHIGRFAIAKNHPFLIDIFAEIHTKEPNSILLLIGEGDGESEIKSKVQKLGLEDSVIFYGTTKEIPQMLWVMDAFVLPSLFEGNPVVGIEAQAASTPCFFSDTITKMCKLTDMVQYLSLEDGAEVWADAVICAQNTERHLTEEEMAQHGYDIRRVAEHLQEIYVSHIVK